MSCTDGEYMETGEVYGAVRTYFRATGANGDSLWTDLVRIHKYRISELDRLGEDDTPLGGEYLLKHGFTDDGFGELKLRIWNDTADLYLNDLAARIKSPGGSVILPYPSTVGQFVQLCDALRIVEPFPSNRVSKC